MAAPTLVPKKHPYDQWAPDTRALEIVGDKWTLLIVRDLISGPTRFGDLQRRLPGICTEQLRSRLNRMVADGLLTRQRYREVPPRVDYELTERARDLIPVLGALARWGYEWSWTKPRRGEAVDIGAIFRLAPALLSPPKSMKGIVECVFSFTPYTITILRGVVTVASGSNPDHDAIVYGTEKQWIQSLSPAAIPNLIVEGDADLARFVLMGLAPKASVDDIAGRRAA